MSITSLLLRRTRKPSLPTVLALRNGVELPLTIRRNARAKRLILRLTPGADGVLLTVPKNLPDRMIAPFLDRHLGWVEDRAAKAPVVVSLIDGALIPFRGATLRLVHAPNRRSSALAVLDEQPTMLVGGAAEHFPRRVVDVLKREARADLQSAVERHSSVVGLRPTALSLKDTRSRWGSCSADRRLAFSWRIVMAPPPVLDYLAAHEVAHFREMNHGPRFWALCRELCPGMDEGRDWLKRHGASLHAIAPSKGT